MSKDYKLPEQKPRGSGSSLVLGIFIGLVLGLGIALGVAWYINKMPSPFATRPPLEPPKGADPAPRPQIRSPTFWFIASIWKT